MHENEISGLIIGAAIEVHKDLGPGQVIDRGLGQRQPGQRKGGRPVRGGLYIHRGHNPLGPGLRLLDAAQGNWMMM